MELTPKAAMRGVRKEGWVVKQSRTLKRWRKRWLVFTNLHLSTYKQERVLRNPTEKLALATFRAITSTDEIPTRPFIFHLETTQRSFLFSVESKEERDEWIGVIAKSMSRPSVLQDFGDDGIPLKE